MSALSVIFDAIKQIEAAAGLPERLPVPLARQTGCSQSGCTCFLASECDPKPALSACTCLPRGGAGTAHRQAMYARLYWEEPKPCQGVIWANGPARAAAGGQGWAILPEAHSKKRAALMDVLDRLPRQEIYTFINGIEKQIADGGRVEFSAIADVLYIRVSWRDIKDYCYEEGFGKDFFGNVSIERLIESANVARQEVKR